jgi:hypothetical protein
MATFTPLEDELAKKATVKKQQNEKAKPNTVKPDAVSAVLAKFNTWQKSVIGAVALVVLVALYASFQPDSFFVERAIIISAPPAKIFDLVNDFHDWAKWSPWEKMDPNMKKTFDGPESGEGAVYHWVGNEKVGEGTMTILESKKNDHVKIKVDFLKPYQASNTVTFTFQVGENQTLVTWGMTGKNNFMSKVMQLFTTMDKMVGNDFQNGLEGLKVLTQPGYKRQ